ncbi:hypothetical protein I4U23_012004 [Adineta vaga]|nr:hypothetical protein I4U23_012004 [Adineta vaga]
MSNLSISNDSTWTQHEIDAIWRTINLAPTDPISHWVTIASFIFAILGLISNSLSVIVLNRLSVQLSTFVYLTGLSLSDMITCLSIAMTYSLDSYLQTRRSTVIVLLLRNIDIVFGAVAAGSRTLSLWISTAVTMDRWVLICYPIYAKTFCTLARAKIITGTFFLMALLYSIPLFFEYEIIYMKLDYPTIDSENDSISEIDKSSNHDTMFVTKGYSNLARLRLFRWIYVFFNVIFVYTLPTITIISFNIQLIRALRQVRSRAKRLGKHTSTNGKDQRIQNRSNQSKYSVTMMVIAVVLTLLLCRSPTIVLWILWSFDSTIKAFFNASSSALVRRFHSIANLIAVINAATNFLPFCVFGQIFRAECLNIYCCRKSQNDLIAQQFRRKQDGNDDQRNPINVIVQQPITLKNGHEQITEINSPKEMIKLHDVPLSNTLSEQGSMKNSSFTTPLLCQTNGC